MAETDSKYHLQKWNENIKLYNEKYNTKYTYKYIVENFTEVIKFTNDEYLLLNPHDDGHHVLNGQSCNLCMCDTRIIDRFYIFDPNNETNKMIVGCKCIEKIDADIDRINIFNMTCNKCNNLYPFKPSAVNGDMCKGCYKEKKKLSKQQEKERIKNEKIQAQQILQAQQEEEFLKQVKERKEQEQKAEECFKKQWHIDYLKQEDEKLKIIAQQLLKIQEQEQNKTKIQAQIKLKLQAQEKNKIQTIDSLICKCGKTYKKGFTSCYNCNIINKRDNTDNIELDF
jgi:hypothetical protein